MYKRLALMEKRYNELNELLMQPEVVSDIKKMTGLLKEQKQLETTVNKYRELKGYEASLEDLHDLMKEKDEEISMMAKEEYEEIKPKIEPLIKELQILLLPTDPSDEKNVIMEIKGAAGGDEANIFAGDLFRMYSKYAESKGWKIEMLNVMHGTMGGFSSIEFIISGERVYSQLKYEAGVHRVQRVPETESQGRVHTSTATVIVMPEAEELDINVPWSEVKFDTFFSSGPGGQSVNTTHSAVRLTHIPTGIVVSCQDGKSQHDNRDKAYKLLISRVYQMHLEEKLAAEGKERLSMVGSGDRSEKMRTYNYPQNRITDHRFNITLNRLDAIIDGDLDLILVPLLNEVQSEALKGSTK